MSSVSRLFRIGFMTCQVRMVTSLLVVLTLFTGVSHAVLSFDFEYIDDVTGGFASRGWLDPNSPFQQNIVAAAEEWGREFDSSETIVVDVVSDFGIARAGGTHSLGRIVGQAPGGQNIWEPGPLTRILTGNNPGESFFGFDIKLSFNPSFVENNYWFDPQPELRTDPVLFNQGDFISVVMHEFGHAWAMAGFRSFSPAIYGQLDANTITLYDSNTYFGGNGNPLSPGGTPNPMFFSGSAAAAEYGSDVPLTHVPQGDFLANQNFYHLSTCQGTDGLDGSLMNGCAIPNGERLPLTNVDLAIFEDIGYLIVVPMPGDFDNNGIVDGEDFLLWQRDPSVGSLADWEANYGPVPPLSATSAAIPEPTTCTLALAALCLAMSRRRAH